VTKRSPVSATAELLYFIRQNHLLVFLVIWRGIPDPVAVVLALSSPGDSAIRYVLPVLWMTSCFHVMGHAVYGAGYGREMLVTWRLHIQGRSFVDFYGRLRSRCEHYIFALWFLSSASRVQHVSDLHPKFALTPHQVYKYMQTSNLRRLRLGEEKRKKIEDRKKIETTGQKYNGLPYSIGRP